MGVLASSRGIIGTNLRYFRLMKQWTQKQLEIESGVARGTISNIEVGVEINPGMDKVQKLASALGITMDQLIKPMGTFLRDDIKDPEHALSKLHVFFSKAKDRTDEMEQEIAWMKAACDLVSDGVCVQKEGQVVFFNKAGLQILGYPQGKEFEESDPLRYIKKEDQEIISHCLRDSGEEAYRAELSSDNGSTKPIWTRSQDIDHQGKTLRISVFRDTPW